MLEIYFLISMIYTVILFLFFHGSIVDRYSESNNVSPETIEDSMFMFYVMSIIFGGFSLLLNVVYLFIAPKCCIWLHWYYKDKKEEN
jgi:predicted membrane protein